MASRPTRFLGRLGDEHQRAMPLVLESNERLRRADPACHMDVVAAAMGHKGLSSLPDGLVVAGIGQTVFSSIGSASISVRTMMVGPSPFL